MTDPPFRVVSEQSEADIAKSRSRDGLDYPLRALAANIIRIVRGAGQPHYLIHHLAEVRKAFDAYQVAHGHVPPGHEVQSVLSYKDEWDRAYPGIASGRADDLDYELEHADRQMVRGALQLVASLLIDETHLQQDHGEQQLHRGADLRHEARQRRREARSFTKPSAAPVGTYAPPNLEAKKVKHVIRYRDGTPVLPGGRRRKKKSTDDSGEPVI
jgi:hypothetical protein